MCFARVVRALQRGGLREKNKTRPTRRNPTLREQKMEEDKDRHAARWRGGVMADLGGRIITYDGSERPKNI